MSDDRFPNIMTVDVEDWFHILEIEGGYTRRDWDTLEQRVVANTDRLLGLFDEAGVRATFFIVGWVAKRQPDMVRRIAAAGHEISAGFVVVSHAAFWQPHAQLTAAGIALPEYVAHGISGCVGANLHAVAFGLAGGVGEPVLRH